MRDTHIHTGTVTLSPPYRRLQESEAARASREREAATAVAERETMQVCVSTSSRNGMTRLMRLGTDELLVLRGSALMLVLFSVAKKRAPDGETKRKDGEV